MSLQSLFYDTIQLCFPHHCCGCNSDVIDKDDIICAKCVHELPLTEFENQAGNAVEKIFTGRGKIDSGFSLLYFTKGKIVQHMLHELKYKQNTAVGKYFGECMGRALKRSERFQKIDALIPLPLYAHKEKKRGYNQAAIICRGIEGETELKTILKNVLRLRATETQTRKHRAERWQNVEGSFAVRNPGELEGKHLLLVDDVLTTGATLEACAEVLLQIPGVKVSVATVAIA